MTPSEIRRNAYWRAQGYQRARDERRGNSSGGLILLFGVVYLMTWALPLYFIYDLWVHGWSYTLHDFTRDNRGIESDLSLYLTAASAVLCLVTIAYGIKKITHR
jgi:hypothetical protein